MSCTVLHSLGVVLACACLGAVVGESPDSGCTYSEMGVSYMARLSLADTLCGRSAVAMGALGLGKMMSASEESSFVSKVVVVGEVTFVYACRADVGGTVWVSSTDVMLTGVNACLIAVIHVGAYDESCCVPVRIEEVRVVGHRVGDPLHNMGCSCRFMRDGIGLTLSDA